MDLVSLITMCSLASVSSVNDVAYQIATSNDVDVFGIDDVTTGDTFSPTSEDEARGIVAALLKRNHNIRVGLLLVSAKDAIENYGVGVGELLDPCTNISVGTSQLESARKKYNNKRSYLSYYIFKNKSDGKVWAEFVLDHENISVDKSLGKIFPTSNFEGFTKPTLFISKKTKLVSSSEKEKKNAKRHHNSSPKKFKIVSGKKKSLSKRGRKLPQPDVTSERLPTTKDLKLRKKQ